MITQTRLVAAFECLGDKCEDTCCQNWSMQVDDATLARYRERAPELLEAVEKDEGGNFVMKRDPTTRLCVKTEDGLCGIHKKFGSEMLGDACHFYPRVTRSLQGKTRMTATPSCPQVVRLMLAMDDAFSDVEASVDRLPQQMKNYATEGMTEASASAVHRAFIDAALDESTPPEAALARISNVARRMAMLDAKTLDQAVPLYLRLAATGLPAPENHPADAFNLLHALCGLIVASHKPISPRLARTIADMEAALHATLDWEKVHITLSSDSADAIGKVISGWDKAHYAHALRRYLAMELSAGCFPFAGLGNDAAERITIIGVRFATVKLALMCAHAQHGPLPEEEVVRIIQSLSRFLDHLGSATYSLVIYHETGWTKEARLLGLFS